MTHIHPTAIVDPKAELAADVQVGPYSIIGPGVHLGEGCLVDTHVHIKGNTKVGPNNQFFHACLIGEVPQHSSFKYEPHSKVIIGEGNIFREYTQVHISTTEQGTIIGDHNFIMSLVHLAHDVQVGNRVTLVHSAILGGHVVVEDHAYISALTAIHQHIQVGTCAIISAVSGVAQNVPPYVIAQGERPKARGLNTVGMRRAGFSSQARQLIKKAFKIFYTQESSVTEVLERIREEVLEECDPASEGYLRVRHFVDFIENSKRGVIPSARKTVEKENIL